MRKSLFLLAVAPLAMLSAPAQAVEAISVDPNAAASVLTNPPFTLGWRFTPTKNLFVNRLGLFDHAGDGFLDSHEVGLWNNDGLLLATVTFSSGTSGTLLNGFRFLSVGSTELSAGQNYFIGALFSTGNDRVFFPPATGFAANPDVGFGGATFAAGGVLANPTSAFGGDGFVGPNFSFSLAAVPEPTTWAMMILGFGVIGGAMRRRKAAVRTSVRFA